MDKPSVRFHGTTAVVLGAAGFLGSHLCDRLLDEGAHVVGIDNFLTGSRDNLAHLDGHARFQFAEHDVTQHLRLDGRVDYVLHFASPASPADYQRWPIQTLKVGSLGTHNALGLARAKGARVLMASTSEVYGDPLVSPQPERYLGNVDPVGPRGMYDEAKRFAEALCVAYQRQHGMAVRIARIFNTYGPRMRRDDGRAVPAFFDAAMRHQPLPVRGGTQTRSLCYVDDMVEGLLRLLLSDVAEPVNLGSEEELTVRALADAVQQAAGTHPGVSLMPAVEGDPRVRRPDISLARAALAWQPAVSLADGLARTAAWLRARQDASERPVTPLA